VDANIGETMVANKKEMSEERWTNMIVPVEAFIEGFVPTTEDEEDRVELVKMNLRRGSRNAANRGNIIRQWRTEFSAEIESGEYGFNNWARTKIPEGVVKAMKKVVVSMSKPRKAFWDACPEGQKPTFSIKVGDERQTFQHPTFEHWDEKEAKAHLSKLKKMHTDGEDWTQTAPVFEVKAEESNAEETA